MYQASRFENVKSPNSVGLGWKHHVVDFVGVCFEWDHNYWTLTIAVYWFKFPLTERWEY